MKVWAFAVGLLCLQACGVKGPPMPPLGKAVKADSSQRKDNDRIQQP
jgi:predicted small lipoprotein YifL